jgi:hypothetical protein
VRLVGQNNDVTFIAQDRHDIIVTLTPGLSPRGRGESGNNLVQKVLGVVENVLVREA